ncbi:MAG: hypothetical protein NTZ05_04110 [Chloroflexi bacterium]|nr:hypothetical protein [Chloroflexota bacterium]
MRSTRIPSPARGKVAGTPTATGGAATVPAADTDEGPGAVQGLVTGAVTGVLVAAASAMLLIPGVGPIVAGGMLASTLTGGAIWATMGGLLGAFIHLNVPEHEAHHYNQEF